MKKLFATMLFAFTTLCLFGCGGGEESAGNVTVKTENSQNEKEKEKIDFQELVLVDNDTFLMKVTDIEPNSMLGYTLKVYLENKSPDIKLQITAIDGYVNSLQSNPLWGTEIDAGKKVNAEINFSTELPFDVDEYSDIELDITAQDYDTWGDVYSFNEIVHIYPYGEENTKTYVRESKETDNVLVSNEYLDIILTDIDPEGMWGYSLNLYVLNKSDIPVLFGTESVSINGFMMDPFYGAEIASGKSLFSSISWFPEDFESNGIEEVENIELYFHAQNSDTWDSLFNTDKIIIEP